MENRDGRPLPTQCTLHFSDAAKTQTGAETVRALSQKFDISVNPHQPGDNNTVMVNIGSGTDKRPSCTAGFLRIQTSAESAVIGEISQEKPRTSPQTPSSLLTIVPVNP